MTVRIRAATTADLDAVIALWRTDDVEETVTDDVESLRHLLTHDPGALLVAESDGGIVGSLIAAWDGWRGNLYRLVVAPPLRRSALGLELVRAGEQRILDLGGRRFTALVLGHYDHATGFWEAAGFEWQEPMRRYVRTLTPSS